VDEQLGSGTDVILEIDWQGAEQIRNLYPAVCSIFILPPSLKTLRERLQTRAQDSEETIERRMRKAVNEITHVAEADYIVINDDFHEAVEDLKSIIRANRLRVVVQQHRKGALLAELTRS
ncbi:MAG: guanylate kinase, partial [Gammaproteobacteria bacterium]